MRDKMWHNIHACDVLLHINPPTVFFYYPASTKPTAAR